MLTGRSMLLCYLMLMLMVSVFQTGPAHLYLYLCLAHRCGDHSSGQYCRKKIHIQKSFPKQSLNIPYYQGRFCSMSVREILYLYKGRIWLSVRDGAKPIYLTLNHQFYQFPEVQSQKTVLSFHFN